MNRNANPAAKEHDVLVFKDDIHDVPTTTLHSYSLCGALITFFINLILGFTPVLFSPFTVQPQEEALVTFWGNLTRVYKPGVSEIV
jgi:hypothetical protein